MYYSFEFESTVYKCNGHLLYLSFSGSPSMLPFKFFDESVGIFLKTMTTKHVKHFTVFSKAKLIMVRISK